MAELHKELAGLWGNLTLIEFNAGGAESFRLPNGGGIREMTEVVRKLNSC